MPNDKKREVEEMARVIYSSLRSDALSRALASLLYGEGYRKQTDTTDLLREKDALIAEKTKVIEDLQLGWSEDQERVRKILDEKDAEIERLKKICHSYALQYGTVRDKTTVLKRVRFETISEVVERFKASLTKPEYPWDCFYVTDYQIDQIAEKLTGGWKYQEYISRCDDLKNLGEFLKANPTIKQYRGYTETKSYGFDVDGVPISMNGEVWFDNPFFTP